MARKNSVDIIIRAKDQASKKFRTIGGAAGSMGSMLKKAAAGVLIYFSARAIKNFVAESLQAYGRQEAAVKSLTDALELLGIKDKAEVKDLEEFASSIQRVTTHGDEAVLELMAMGVAMGKLSGEPLKNATKAAIGLATAYKMDVTAAMRLVARAAVGDTATLARYGIKLGDAKTTQDKFNKVLEIGARNFRLAEGEANTYLGRIKQMMNVLGDVFKEQIGEALMPMFHKWAVSTMEWAENNKKAIGDWAKKAVAYVALVKDVFVSFVNYMKEDWRSAIAYAFDSFLRLLRATFEAAVTMAIAGGRGIWLGVKEGLGVGKYLPGTNRAAQEEYKKQGLPLHPITSLKWGSPKDTEKYEAIKAQIKEEAYKKNISEIVKMPIATAMEAYKSAMTDIAGKMPGAMKADVDKAFAKYQRRLLGIEGPEEGGYVAYKPGGEDESEAIKKALAGKRGRWSPLESRFLTMAPGSTLDLDRKILDIGQKNEKTMREMAATLKNSLNELIGISKVLKNQSSGVKLGITNFA